MSKIKRSIGAVAVVAVFSTALIGGSPAVAAKKCKKFKPSKSIQSDSGETAAAAQAKVQKITDKYSAKKPLTINYDHGPAFWFIADPADPTNGQSAAVEDTQWFNFQVDSKKKFVGLHIRQEWNPQSPSDMDLYLYDKNGSQAGTSGEFNVIAGQGVGTGDGGMGYEQVLGLGVSDCSGYTVESRAFTTAGEAMTLKVWLGPIR